MAHQPCADAEFVALSDGIWPQLYWDTFNTSGNHTDIATPGFPVPNEGTTPEFLLDATAQILRRTGGRSFRSGRGRQADPQTWPRFTHRAWELGQYEVSVWRLGVTRDETVGYLGVNPPGPEPLAPPPTATPTSKAGRDADEGNPFQQQPTSTRTADPQADAHSHADTACVNEHTDAIPHP